MYNGWEVPAMTLNINSCPSLKMITGDSSPFMR
jgi:hypothetical protein